MEESLLVYKINSSNKDHNNGNGTQGTNFTSRYNHLS